MLVTFVSNLCTWWNIICKGFFYLLPIMNKLLEFVSILVSCYWQSTCSVWAEATNTTMLLENNLVTPNRNISPFNQFPFFARVRNIVFSAQKFGEMCITNCRDNANKAKLANLGAPGIWVGFTEGHPTSTYHVFNPKTKKIFLT